MNRPGWIGNKIVNLINKVILILMGVLVSLVFLQVILRYVFSSGMVWAEELERYMFVWLMFLGIILGVYKKKHIAITIVIEKMGKYSKWFYILTYLFIGGFFAVLSWLGLQFSLKSFAGVAAVLPIKLGYVYSIIPVASILGLIFCVLLIIESKEEKP